MTLQVLTGARLVDQAEGVRLGWISIESGVIQALGTGEYQGAAPGAEITDLGGDYLLSGAIDLHCHGGGGASYAVPEQLSGALDFHASHGTAFSYLSLVSDSPHNLRGQAAGIRAAGEHDERILGVHFEGPFLAVEQAGAHAPEHLLTPQEFGIEQSIELLSLADSVTLAPELPGALEVVRELSARGVRVAIGHTACDYDTALAAFEAGAVAVTHLFNAMNPIHHRNPGPILAARDCGSVIVELIVDGQHLHPSTVLAAFELFPGRVAVVTDAMSAAGCQPGESMLGSLSVTVSAESATLTGTTTLAGSLLTMDRALANLLSYGVPLPHAVGAMTSTPARLAPAERKVGHLAAGYSARGLRRLSKETLQS